MEMFQNYLVSGRGYQEAFRAFSEVRQGKKSQGMLRGRSAFILSAPEVRLAVLFKSYLTSSLSADFFIC